MEQTSLIERFIRYVKIDTQSDEESAEHPSTGKQRNLAKILVEELNDLGLAIQLCCPIDYSPPPLSMEFSGKNIGVSSHSLLQVIFPTQGSNPGLLHCR